MKSFATARYQLPAPSVFQPVTLRRQMDSDGRFGRFGKKPQSYVGRELRELVIFLHFLWLGVVDEMQLSPSMQAS